MDTRNAPRGGFNRSGAAPSTEGPWAAATRAPVVRTWAPCARARDVVAATRPCARGGIVCASTGVVEPLGDATPTAMTLAMSFLAGGLAGCTGKTVVAPFDRTKILFQVSNKRFTLRGVARELRRIVAEEGVLALFKGNLATVMRVLPYSGIQLMSFDNIKPLVARARGRGAGAETDAVDRLVAGAGAGALSVAVTYPLDLMRARLAVQVSYLHYSGLAHAFRTAYKEEGFTALYRGVGPTMLGILPYAALSFYTFDTLKHVHRERYGTEPDVYFKLGAGALAGAIGQSCTYPLDVIRRRMQTMGFKGDGIGVRSAPGGLLATGRFIVAEEGVRGLFKGLSLNWIKGPLAVGISFTVFDFLKRLWGIVPVSELRRRGRDGGGSKGD